MSLMPEQLALQRHSDLLTEASARRRVGALVRMRRAERRADRTRAAARARAAAAQDAARRAALVALRTGS